MTNTPLDTMNKVLLMDPGMGIRLGFKDPKERSRFRWRCYAIMGAEAKRNRELKPSDPYWGRHSWDELTLRFVGETDIWIGKLRPPETVSTEVPYPGRGG